MKRFIFPFLFLAYTLPGVWAERNTFSLPPLLSRLQEVRWNESENSHYQPHIMKQILFFSFLLLCPLTRLSAQQTKYSTFYYQRATLFEALPVAHDDIIFLGNSLTNGGEWSELFQNSHVKNRGISGDRTQGVYDRLDPILKGKPAKIFFLIGVNDLAAGLSPDSIVQGIRQIAQKIRTASPSTRLYIQSLLPMTDTYGGFPEHTTYSALIPGINKQIRELAVKEKATYIDLYTSFVDPLTGELDAAYSNDGLHLLGNGYLKWRDIVQPYVDEK